MKDDKSRKAMVKRVHDTHKKWPTFASLPENRDKGAAGVEVEGNPHDQANYVTALYEACRDATPIGRAGNAIIVDEEA